MPSNDLFSLPVGPDELCFDKNEFIKKSFSVDDFLHEHRNAAGLEEMRDDLGIYLKVLRSAMIELINEDYVDFVNLSSNLVGLDQSINGIKLSLEQLKDEIIMIKQMLNDTMSEVSNCLAEKLLLKSHLKSVHCVGKVYGSIEKLENLLKRIDGGNDRDDDIGINNINSVILERSSLEMVQLEYNMEICEMLFADKLNDFKKSKMLHDSFMDKYKKYLLKTFSNNNLMDLELCLRIYCTLNRCFMAEQIVRFNCVAPFMQTIITEQALQNCPQGLFGIYRQILQFIETKLQNLLRLTASKKEYNFLLNSCWTDVEQRLETQMSSIFAPGNPDMFYQKYQHTQNFLQQFELLFGTNADFVAKFHKHPQYHRFQTRWNLPVYFQIRFQEIGGEMETICSKEINENTIYTSGNEYKLKSFDVAWKCITKCWSNGVYLSEIFIRFWTLTLQLIGRISTWIDDSLRHENGLTNKIDFYIAIHLDVQKFATNLTHLLSTIIMEKLPKTIQSHDGGSKLLENCFNESIAKLNERLKSIEQCIETEILKKSIQNIRQVSDIPRLYRKTNKDVPSKACGYVEQMLDTTKSFYRQYNDKWDAKLMKAFLVQVFGAINVKYYTAVDDVLTSVQKTEESLRRLKNLREKSSALTSSISADRLASSGMSDDDKIRLQLHVDIMHWTNEIELLQIDRNAIDKLPQLIQLVEESTKIRVTAK